MLNLNQTTPLTTEQIKSLAPSIFTEKGAETTSSQYIHIPTSRVIDDMKTLGWNVTDAKEVKTRKKEKIGFQKHLVIFQNPNIIIDGDDGDKVIPQILLQNSHDGSSCFVFKAGLFRLICENGLVIATQELADMKIRHMGYSFEDVSQIILSIIESLPITVEKMNKMKQTIVQEETAISLAQKSLTARFSEDEIKSMDIDLKELITPTRKEDEGDDLWTVFNIIQEKIVDGDFNYMKGTKIRKARKIKNFRLDIEVNQKLFNVVEEFITL